MNGEEPRVRILHGGVNRIEGPLMFVRNVHGVGLYEKVEVMTGGEPRIGRVVSIDRDNVVVEVFQGTDGLSLSGSRVRFLGEPVKLRVGPGMLGRVFDGVGRPIDGGPGVVSDKEVRVDGEAINPVRRAVPREFIETGFSAIDAMNSLVRGQKLPIFSGSGLSHDRLASMIAHFARLRGDDADQFAVVFAAIGVTFDTADRFRRDMDEFGATERIALFLNLANDPSTERLLTPRIALTCAEHLAFEEDMHVLVILTDLTNYCEALREVSSSHGEIPSRRGYPGYMYSDLASLYERAGRIEGRTGSITQLPILTMPNDDITHPIADLSGYITEGQVVLDRDLERRRVFPPVKLLPSLSRLMNDGIGEGLTHADHPALASQMYSAYAQSTRLRLLSSVVGEEGLSAADRALLRFGENMEARFIGQGGVRRSLEQTMELGWELLSEIPDELLVRLSDAQMAQHIAPRRSSSEPAAEERADA
ncbi:MAG: V-type ATP synthase subunit B [Proteobacteria bacterium]|nr:MAG: V-type ATP synthase subunit B [Pseudomonadota bacterium]